MKISGEISELLIQLTDGRIDEAGWDRLTATLRTSSEAMDSYIKFVSLHGMLAYEAGGRIPASATTERRGASGWSRRRLWMVRFVAAAVIVIGFTAAMSVLISLGRSERVSKVASPIATLTDATGAVWGNGDSFPLPGSPLKPGFLRLRSGQAQIEFYSGARITLTGPAEFGLNSENRGFLKAGKLLAYCPASAHGFTVGAPGCAVVDLGTRFALRVADGVDEVHVISGRVRVETPLHGSAAGQVQLLTEHNAARVLAGDSNIQPIAFDTTLLDPHDSQLVQAGLTPQQQPIHHWTFNETAQVFRDLTGGADLQVDPHGPHPGHVQTGLPGPVGTAVNLHGAALTSVKPLISSGDSYTITAWVKPGEDFDGRECQIFAAGFGGQQFVGLSLLDVGKVHHAALFFNGDPTAGWSAVLSVDGACSKGEWVHLAAVSPGLDSKEPMKLYVNGVLQPLRTLFNPAGRPTSPGWPDSAYANVGHKDGARTGNLSLDDLRLYRGELSAAQVRQIMQDRDEK